VVDLDAMSLKIDHDPLAVTGNPSTHPRKPLVTFAPPHRGRHIANSNSRSYPNPGQNSDSRPSACPETSATPTAPSDAATPPRTSMVTATERARASSA
jgi:hypothetical protein